MQCYPNTCDDQLIQHTFHDFIAKSERAVRVETDSNLSQYVEANTTFQKGLLKDILKALDEIADCVEDVEIAAGEIIDEHKGLNTDILAIFKKK